MTSLCLHAAHRHQYPRLCGIQAAPLGDFGLISTVCRELLCCGIAQTLVHRNPDWKRDRNGFPNGLLLRIEPQHIHLFDNDRHGFEQLLRWCDAGGDLHRQWIANLAAARRCKEFNDRNGAVVSLRLNHVQKLLLAIRGSSASPVYSPQLNGTAAFTPRELGRA